MKGQKSMKEQKTLKEQKAMICAWKVNLLKPKSHPALKAVKTRIIRKTRIWN